MESTRLSNDRCRYVAESAEHVANSDHNDTATHEHELALCQEATLDIMTHPWVSVDTHSTRCSLEEALGGSAPTEP